MKLKWQQAPVKTQWGDEMVVTSVAIDNDHTVCLYCEREQKSKVEAMFAQRTWVGLTEAQCGVLWKTNMTPFEYYQAIEAKLKEKNT